MNIVLTAKLTDQKLLTKLVGLQYSDSIHKITLVRRSPIEGAKISNVTPSPYIANSMLLFEIWRTFQLLYLMSKKENQVAIGIQFFLHGFTAIFAAKVFRKKSIVWLIGSDVMLHGQKGVLKWIFYRSLMMCDLILIMGNKMRLFLEGIPSSKIFEMQSYIDPEVFRIDPSEEKDWDIGFIGNLVDVKNVEIILGAVAINFRNGKPFRMLIVGEGPRRAKLEAISSELGISDLVTFWGGSRDISALINRTRLIILSSKSEGLPAILLESAFCGTPSISSDVGEVAEEFKQYKCCEVVKPTTAEAFANAIDRTLSNPEYLSAMSKQSILFRDDYLSKWGKEGQANQWALAVTKVLN